MVKTALDVTDEDIRVYRETARRRASQPDPEREAHRERGWQAARRAAALLREEYAATRVAVYGSLARGTGFTKWSDVDLFAEGIPPDSWINAIGEVFESEDAIEVNLAPLEAMKPHIRERALAEAVDL